VIAAIAGLGLVALLALPWTRQSLESVMILHMLVQIPLLAGAGALMVMDLPGTWRARLASWNRNGVSGILMAVAASSWWMAPRALDAALASPAMELAKFVSLPLFVGAPLALSWSWLGGIGRGFVIANVLPMWAVVGWLYLAAPVRVCNFYLIEDQAVAGTGLLAASIGLGLIVGGLAFRRHPTPSAAPAGFTTFLHGGTVDDSTPTVLSSLKPTQSALTNWMQ
jgi:hypothetical protein